MLAVAATLLAATARGAFQLREVLSIRSAAAELSTTFVRARAYALTRGVAVALKFRRDGGRYEWALYRDGNGNGVRTAEIASGVDRSLALAVPWSRADVRPGILSGTPVPDPSSPGTPLDRLDDRSLQQSDLCDLFSEGEEHARFVYLWDGRDGWPVVRVSEGCAKVRTIPPLRGERGWRK